MEPKPAEGYEAVAIELGIHVRNYVPTGFREAIGVFDFAPRFAASEAEEFHNELKNGTLREYLKNPKDYMGLPRSFKPYAQEAIVDFFNSGIHQNYLD